MLCNSPALISLSIPTSTKPLYRLYQRLRTPKGIGRVIGIQQCPGPEQPLWYYRLSDVPDQEPSWEPTWWLEDQVWPEHDLFLISVDCHNLDEPHQTFYSTIEDLLEGFQGIANGMLEGGESWKITLERPKSSTTEEK
jgi:hypothetical protein